MSIVFQVVLNKSISTELSTFEEQYLRARDSIAAGYALCMLQWCIDVGARDWWMSESLCATLYSSFHVLACFVPNQNMEVQESDRMRGD